MHRYLLILFRYLVSDLCYLYCDLGIPLHEWLSEIRSKCCSLVRIMTVRVRSWICNHAIYYWKRNCSSSNTYATIHDDIYILISKERNDLTNFFKFTILIYKRCNTFFRKVKIWSID